jgi:fructoselysine-6-P-deglycase FrlB-like protein
MILYIRQEEEQQFVDFVQQEPEQELKHIITLDCGSPNKTFMVSKYELASKYNEFEFGRMFEKYLTESNTQKA